jgi:outer membrane biosynthesis protein TonB
MRESASYQVTGFSFEQHLIGISVSITLHLGLVAGLFYFDQKSTTPDEPLEEIQWVSLTALGEERPPQSVPRIVAPPPPPPPEEKAVSLSRQIKKDEPKKKKKKKKKKEPPKKKKRESRKASKKRKKKPPKKLSADDLFGRQDDRADNGPRLGHKKGSAIGTSLTLNEATLLGEYTARISRLIERNLNIPASISASDRKRLTTQIYVRLGKKLKIKGNPKIKKSSKNRFFDQAALRAVGLFTEKGPKAFPSPPSELKRYVFKKGFLIKIKGD